MTVGERSKLDGVTALARSLRYPGEIGFDAAMLAMTGGATGRRIRRIGTPNIVEQPSRCLELERCRALVPRATGQRRLGQRGCLGERPGMCLLRIRTQRVTALAGIVPFAMTVRRISESGHDPPGRSIVEILVAAGTAADHAMLEGKRPRRQQGLAIGPRQRDHDQTDHRDYDQSRHPAAHGAQTADRNTGGTLHSTLAIRMRACGTGATGARRAGAVPAIAPAYRRTIRHTLTAPLAIRTARAWLAKGEPPALPAPVRAVVGAGTDTGICPLLSHHAPTLKA